MAGAGDDLIVAGGGKSRITGGEGADVFALSVGGKAKIVDFEPGVDRIHFDGFLDVVAKRSGTALIHDGDALAVLKGIDPSAVI